MTATTKETNHGPEHEIRAFTIEALKIEARQDVADGDDESSGLRVAGYAAVYERAADIGGWFTEIIRKGAFKRAIDERQDVVLLFNHDESTVMARTTSGTLLLREDDTGLWFEAELDPQDADAQRVLAKIRRGDVHQGSFSFTVRTETWHQDVDPPLREILDVDLFDVSPVTFPAYADTEVFARGRVVAPPPQGALVGRPAAPRSLARHRQRHLARHRAYIAQVGD